MNVAIRCMIRRASLVAACLAPAAIPVSAAEVSYGPLPPGAISASEVSGVHAEICRDHVFDPFFAKVRLPSGYRLLTAAALSKQDPSLASLLQRDSRYGSHAVGALCFMSVERFIVDGMRVHPEGATPMAFWWARAERDSGAEPDTRMLGKTEWVQLASWYDRGTEHQRILRTDPMAEFVELSMLRTGVNQWEMRLALPHEVVTATVHGSGQRKPRKATQPGFMTVAFTGDSASLFTVYTYFGHHHQDAEGRWEAKGKGVFSGALPISGGTDGFQTFFQDGWQARGGLYEMAPAAGTPGKAGP